MKAGVWPTVQGGLFISSGLLAQGQATLCGEATMFLQNLHGGFSLFWAVEYVCCQGLTQICKICEEQALSTRPMCLLEPPIARRGARHACLGSHPRCSFNHFLLAPFCIDKGPGGWTSEPRELSSVSGYISLRSPCGAGRTLCPSLCLQKFQVTIQSFRPSWIQALGLSLWKFTLNSPRHVGEFAVPDTPTESLKVQ